MPRPTSIPARTSSCSPRPTSTRPTRTASSGACRTTTGRTTACCWAAATASTSKSSIAFNAWGAGGTFGTINTASGSYTLNTPGFTNQFVSQIESAPYSDIGGSAFYQLDAGSLRDVKIGVDGRRTTISDYNNLYASVTAAPSTFIANGEHRFEGLFAQGTYRFTTVPVDVTIGLRGDFWQALNASVFTVNSATNNVVPNTSASSFDPRIGLKFYASDEVTVRAAIYRNFSAPGMNQMYRSFASGTSFTAINPSLQPMTNFGQEVGMDFNWKGFSLSGTYFNNNLDNFIDFVTICNTNAACAAPFITAAGLSPSFTTVNQYNNVGNATFQGFELIGSWQALDQLKLTAGYVRHRRLSHQLVVSDTRTDRCSARPGAQLDGHRRRRMAAPPGTGPHRDLAVVPGLLEQHGPYPAERRCHDRRPRRDLFAGEGGGHLCQRAEPYELPVPGHGLLHDVVRGHDGQHHLHPGPGNASHSHRRSQGEVLKGRTRCVNC